LPCAVHDDALFLKLAASISNGCWLGEYNALTLSKGPIFPLFLCFIRTINMPYELAASFFYSLCVVYIICKIRPLFHTNTALFLLSILLFFDPIGFEPRFTRTWLYVSTMYVVAGCLINCFIHKNSSNIFEIFFVFICFGMAYFVREESAIILAVIFFTSICLLIYRIYFKNKIQIIYIISGCCGIMFFHFLLCSINLAFYNNFVDIETTSSPFREAYSQLITISDPIERPDIFLSIDKIHELSKISPSISLIENCMTRGHTHNAWAKMSYSLNLKTLEWFSDENKQNVTGDLTRWELLACAQNAGLYGDASTSKQFYNNIIHDIDYAYKNNLIKKNNKKIVFSGLYIDIGDISRLVKGIIFGIRNGFLKPNRPLQSIGLSMSEGDHEKIVKIANEYHLFFWDKISPAVPSIFSKISYYFIGKIILFYNIFYRVLFSFFFTLCAPILVYAFYKKDLHYFFIVSILTFIAITRHIVLAAIQVTAFNSFVPEYMSIEYSAITILSCLFFDKFAYAVHHYWAYRHGK